VLNGREAVKALLAANRNRRQDLLPIKWQRMAASPFGFFRGAAPLMAADLASQPNVGLTVQICGDAHVQNLGAYASPDGHLVFDLNDFDETIRGPWEWDIKRLATSLVLAGREAGETSKRTALAVMEFVKSYRDSIKAFAQMRVVELARREVRRHTALRPVREVLSKAERATPAMTLKRLTVPARRTVFRFHDRPPVLQHVTDSLAAQVLAALARYRDTLGVDHQQVLDAYRPVDIAFKVVGTGSVGTNDFVVLLLGNGPDDVLFLQIKEEFPSCYSRYCHDLPTPSHQGRRAAEGQKRLQTVTDPFVGWTTIGKREYLVRQLADHKASIDPKELKGATLNDYGIVCGEVLAKAHARTGDAAAIAGYTGASAKLDKAITRFALAYADQTVLYHAALARAIMSGQVKAQAL
jgi:uncharacterized protein (DUF2252 family)